MKYIPSQELCEHDWQNDKMFESGAIMMLTNDQHPFGKEMRQFCPKCKKVRYVVKETAISRKKM